MPPEEKFNIASTEWRVLMQAIRVMRSWHGAPAFDIYYKMAPEMKMIRDVMGSYDSIKQWIELPL